MKYIIIKIVLMLSCLSITIYSQDIALERISTKQGISQNSITSIVQDSIGFLWFGTYDGLNRYDGYEFKVFRHDLRDSNSINHNHIRALCVDNIGNLWIGTVGGGLNFYDQDKEIFISFRYDPDNSSSISYNSITSLLLDKKHNIWIGTASGGVNRFSLSAFYANENNEKKIKFTRFLNTDIGIDNINWNRITSIHQDNEGNIWIGTRYGLSKYNPEIQSFKHFFSDPHNENSLSDNNISAISEDKFGNIWIGNWEHGINKYNIKNQKIIRYPYNDNDPHSLSYNMIMNLYKDYSSNLWIGTWGGGLNKLNNSYLKSDYKDTFTHYKENPKDLYSIHNLSIYSLYQDKSGVLWIGSDWNGLYKNIDTNSKFKHYYSSTNQISSHNQNNVFDLQLDQSGILWLATRHSGINLYDLKNNRSQYYQHNPKDPSSINHNKIRTFFRDRRGRLWIGTEIGLDEFKFKSKAFKHYTLDPENPYGVNIFCIRDDRYGNLWIGTYGLGLYKLNLRTNKISHYMYDSHDSHSIGDNMIWQIHEDRQGNLWIGTDKGGLNLYNYDDDNFTRYANIPENPASISGDKVLTIFESKTGQLWFGTTTGLNKLKNHDEREFPLNFTHYTRHDGLPTNTIHAILEDDHGNLWISSNNGLSNFNTKTEEFLNFDESDGLQDIEFSVNACFKDTLTGELYFGGINGFNVFHPDSIQYNKSIPEVVLTELKILNQPVSVNTKIDDRIILHKSLLKTDEITLSYKDIIFSITFSALHFNSPENNQFAYILEGFEKKWNFVNASQRVATYTNLDPGEYIFRVKASNNDGIWNEKGTSLKIIINPPFWATWWFRILVILLLAGSIVLIYMQRTRIIKRYNKELEENVKIRTQQLEASNKELETFAYSVSHDLRTPLRGINGYAKIIQEDFGIEFSDEAKHYFSKIILSATRMGHLIDNLLKLSRIIRTEIKIEQVNLSKRAVEIVEELKVANPDRKVSVIIQPNMFANVDVSLVNIVLENLFQNAWKFTEPKANAKIEFGFKYNRGINNYYVKDNGVGFNMKYADKLFIPFNRLHSEQEFEGMGIGLASAKKIIEKHGGEIWAEGKINDGTTFYFTLG